MAKDDDHKKHMLELQLALVRMQANVIEAGEKIIVVLEGRDAAGKDGLIHQMTQHLPPRHTIVVALPKPSDRQVTEWYFQRYVRRLPAAGELVIFNRSWYNRAGVERVMGFSTPAQQEQFLKDAPQFEHMLLESGIRLVKYWLDISKDEQAKRLDDRRSNPLKQLKVSDLDGVAQQKWDAYTKARDEMLLRTHTALTPWICVRNDKKKTGRANLIRHLLHLMAPGDVLDDVPAPDPKIVFSFEPKALEDGRLYR
jgi:polyphosphate kinase 2